MAVLRMRNEKICNLALTCDRITYELGYGADTMFHKTYFLFPRYNALYTSLELIFTNTSHLYHLIEGTSPQCVRLCRFS